MTVCLEGVEAHLRVAAALEEGDRDEEIDEDGEPEGEALPDEVVVPVVDTLAVRVCDATNATTTARSTARVRPAIPNETGEGCWTIETKVPLQRFFAELELR